MDRKDIWNLFKLTGKVEYFIKYREMVEKGIDSIGISEGTGDNN